MSEDLTGRVFGRLKVLYKTEKPNNIKQNHEYWMCQCSCGNKKPIRKDALLNGYTQSCGCLQKEKVALRNKQNLVGKVFTHLIVVKQVDNTDKINDGVKWLCHCTCGGEIIVSTKDLNSRRVKSCGCRHGINMINKRFGRLTVINKIESKRERYKCLCDCGNIANVDGIKLRNGHTQSCGCLQKERLSQISKKYNTYDLTGEYGTGYTTNGDMFYFDLEDYDLIKDYCWYKTNAGYIASQINNINVLLHRIVMNAKYEDEVDHKNRKPTDCRKSNLRLCTHNENMKNQSISKNNKSGVTGVYLNKKNGKWKSCIQNNGIIHRLGTYVNKVDAIKSRLNAEYLYFDEFAPQKHLFKEYNIGGEDNE